MTERRLAISRACCAWALLIVVVGGLTMPSWNRDARWILVVITGITTLSAFLAARAVSCGRDRVAGMLLVVSAVSTTMAYVLGVPALVLGLVLALRPRLLIGALDRVQPAGAVV